MLRNALFEDKKYFHSILEKKNKKYKYAVYLLQTRYYNEPEVGIFVFLILLETTYPFIGCKCNRLSSFCEHLKRPHKPTDQKPTKSAASQ